MEKKAKNAVASNAMLIHKYLRSNGPSTKGDICSGVGIDEREFGTALRVSRRDVNSEHVANEIIGVTQGKVALYYSAKNAAEADAYINQRYKIVNGHFVSISLLMQKEALKFPEKSREISMALKMVERAREDLLVLLEA